MTDQRIPITDADRHWSRVALAGSRGLVTITRHGRPWVELRPCSEALRAALERRHWTAGARSAALGFCSLARLAHQVGPIIVLRRGRALLVISPAQQSPMYGERAA